MTREGEIGMKSSAPGDSRGAGDFLYPMYPWSTVQDIYAISNNIARERIRFYEESDTVIDDW
jgi:hypothetical protein